MEDLSTINEFNYDFIITENEVMDILDKLRVMSSRTMPKFDKREDSKINISD